MWYGDWAARGALYWPDQVAIVDVGLPPALPRRFTYRELDDRANRLAAWLRDHAGVRKDARVGLVALNGVEVLDALFACGKLGAVLVPYNWRLHPGELGALMRRTAPAALLHSGELRDLTAGALAAGGLAPRLVHLEGEGLPGSTSHADALAAAGAGTATPVSDPDFRETGVACLLFTGGTTGLPRAARITYRQIAWNTFTTMVHEIRPGDVTITHTPMFHTGGLFVYTVPFLTIGGRVVLMRRWDAALALRLLQEEEVTAFFAVPTQYQQLLEAPGFAAADLSRIRYLTSGGAAMPRPLREAWRKVHPIPFKQGFGMTEFGPGVFSFPASEADRKAGSIGLVNQFIEARLVDDAGNDVRRGAVGELLLRGPACCDGYEGPDGVTQEGIDAQGWLHTGDLMRQDEDAYFWVEGRRKDMFISGGENVYPLEIENALLAHPAVAMASVIGVPDPRWGEVGRAFVTMKPGADASEDALLEHARGRLARYKVPKRIVRLDAMPLSAAGKILKTELRKHPLPEDGGGAMSVQAVQPGAMPWWREPTRAQWITFLAAWAGWVLDAFDFTIYVLAMADIMKEFGVGAVATSVSVTLTLILRLVGGVGAGWMADRWGRKLPLVISLVWFAVCDGAVAFAPAFAWVLVFRTLFGLGMGAQWTAGATLAMESWPERSRGTASGILQGSWAIGYILAGIAYWAIEPTWGWRPLFVVAAIPALLALPIWFFVPESQDWQRTRAQKTTVTLADLRAEKVVLRVVWASVLWATSFAVYYGLFGVWPLLLRTTFALGAGQVTWLVIAFNVGMMAGAITWGSIAAKRGVLVALVAPLVILLPALPLYVGSWTLGAPLVGAIPNALWIGAFVAGATGAGISGVTPLLLTSLFPARVRGLSVGVVYHVGALLAAGTSTLVAWLGSGGRLSLGTAIVAVVAAAAAVTIAILFFRPAGALPASALGGATHTPGHGPASPQQS